MVDFKFNEDEDYVTPDRASLGPRMGILESYRAAYDEQQRTSSLYAIDYAMNEINAAQIKSLRDAGEQNLPHAGVDFMDVARFYEDGGTPEQAQRLKTFDDRVEELRKQYPNMQLKTSRQIWDEVKLSAQEAERVAGQRKTMGGNIGSFAGGIVSSIDPRTDPLNALTLPVGGFGKSAAARIATEAGAQSIIEGLNQLTGVQEQRRLLGLESGFGDAATRVAMAGVGGGVIQGVGEVAAKGLRMARNRWFNDTPKDPAPPVPEPSPAPAAEAQQLQGPAAAQPITMEQRLAQVELENLMSGRTPYDSVIAATPIGETRFARARVASDLNDVSRQLDDWTVAPESIIPRSVMETNPRAGYAVDEAAHARLWTYDLDAAARMADPRVFSVYDKLAVRKNELRSLIDSQRPDAVRLREATADLTDRIDAITARLGRTDRQSVKDLSARKRREMEAELAALVKEREAVLTTLKERDTPEMAATRKELMDIDVQMRDLAPVVSSAYSRARGQFEGSLKQLDAVRQMVRNGDAGINAKMADVLNDTTGAPLVVAGPLDPVMRQADRVADKVGPDADAVDYIRAIAVEDEKTTTETFASFRDMVATLMRQEAEEVTLPGTDATLRMSDKIAVPLEDAEGVKTVTIRDLLQDAVDADEDLKAVQTCRI